MSEVNVVENDQMMALAKEMMRRVYAEESPEEIKNWLFGSLGRPIGKSSEESILRWAESFDWYAALLEQRKADALIPESERKIIDFPWPSWRKFVKRLRPGTLMVLAAPDGVGKSSYAEVLGDWWAKRGLKVVYAHYELNQELMLDRRMARHAHIAVDALDAGKLTPEQEFQITDARRRLSEWTGEITYLHTPGWSMEKTIQELNRLHGEGLVDVVIIDYLEKCAPSAIQLKLFGAQSYQREANDVEQLKNFAEAKGIPALMLSQFGKEGKKKDFKDMRRTDIRGAGEKTEKANVVYFFDRDENENGYSNFIDGRFDKNTMGPTGNVKQYIVPEYFTVADLAVNP